MESKCPFKIGTSVGLSNERLNAAKKELKEFKEQNNVEEPDRKSFLNLLESISQLYTKISVMLHKLCIIE